MTGARNVSAGSHLAAAPAYTVVSKSGQRGMQYSDPVLAVEAFARASERDRPFVLRHRSGVTYVIASAKAGSKRIEEPAADKKFHDAHAALVNGDGSREGTVWPNG